MFVSNASLMAKLFLEINWEVGILEFGIGRIGNFFLKLKNVVSLLHIFFSCLLL